MKRQMKDMDQLWLDHDKEKEEGEDNKDDFMEDDSQTVSKVERRASVRIGVGIEPVNFARDGPDPNV